MIEYGEYLKTRKPGLRTTKGVSLTSPTIDKMGNEGKITTTLPADVEVASGDPDVVEGVIATTAIVKFKTSFKGSGDRRVSESGEVVGVYQAAGLGHEGAIAAVKALNEKREAAQKAQADEVAAKLAAQTAPTPAAKK